MNSSKWVRQTHRWLSIAFTMTVIANFVALARGEPPAWVTYSPLFPLALLLCTGLYLFVLPYAARWRSGRPGPSRRPPYSAETADPGVAADPRPGMRT